MPARAAVERARAREPALEPGPACCDHRRVRVVPVLLVLGAACTPTHPKPSQQATPAEAPAQPVEPAAVVEAKAGPPVAEAKVEPPAPVKPPAPAVPDEPAPPPDPRDIAERRAQSAPSLVEPGRFHLAAYAIDSAWIELDVLGDAVALRAPGALAVAEAGANELRFEEDWTRGLRGLEWTWEPIPFREEPQKPSPLLRGFGGRWPGDVYFATSVLLIEDIIDHEPTEDPTALYKFGLDDGWTLQTPETPPRMDVYYTEFVPWRDGQVLATEVWHFDEPGFALDNGEGPDCGMDEEPAPHRPHARRPKPPRQKLVLFGEGRAPAAPKTGVSRLAVNARRTMYVLDLDGVPQRRVAGNTKWTALPPPAATGVPDALAVAGDDTLYVSFCERGACTLQRLRGEAWAAEPLPDGVGDVRGLAIDARDDLWLAAPDGLWRRRASARAPVLPTAPTDRSADAPLDAGPPAVEAPEPWERVALPGVRAPALALPRAVFATTKDDFTWHMRPERPDMSDKTIAPEITALRVRGDELWIAAKVDEASVVLTTRAVATFAFPDFYARSPNDYDYAEALDEAGCPAIALRLGALAPGAADDPNLAAALAEAPREHIALVVSADPRELVAVWTGPLSVATLLDEPRPTTDELAAASAALTAFGARLRERGAAKQAELACWAPAVGRVIALPP